MEKTGQAYAYERADGIRHEITAVVSAAAWSVGLVEFVSEPDEYHGDKDEEGSLERGAAERAVKCEGQQERADGKNGRMDGFVRLREGQGLDPIPRNGGEDEERDPPRCEGKPCEQIYSIDAAWPRRMARWLLKGSHVFRRRPGWKGLSLKLWGGLREGKPVGPQFF
jgi:hypothetical protein